MYAVIVTSGKQYKVAENDVLKVDKLDAEVGSVVQFDQVLAIGGANGELRIGSPVVEGAKISAEVLEQKRDAKVIVFKKKRRHNYRRKNGHRQHVTILRILDVSGKGSSERKKVVKKAAQSDGLLEKDHEGTAERKAATKKESKSSGKPSKSSGGKGGKTSDKKKAAAKK